MLLASDKAALREHCARLDKEEEDEDYGDEDSNEENNEVDFDQDVKPTQNGEHMRFSGEDTQPQKKARNTTSNGDTKLLKWRGREIGEGEIILDENEGSITLKDPRYLKFTGRTDMGPVGSNVLFAGMKISDKPPRQLPDIDMSYWWSECSETAHEGERVGRWG